MTNRRIVCEVAFGFGPFDTLAATDWTELFDTQGPRLRQASWQFGRSNELDHFDTGTATVVLRNRDRALDPDNPSSPYAGDLLPYTPVRLRSKQPTFAVTAWARTSNTVLLTLDVSRSPLPPIGSTVVVDVTDNTFDGTFVVSSYFGPTIIVYTQAGANVTNTPGNGTATEVADEFYGFVQSGWQQELAPIGASDCVLELVDMLGVMSGYTLPDVFHQAIMNHNPVGFWVLDGGNSDVAESVADQGSSQTDGVLYGEGVTLGDRVISPGHHPAARFDVEIDDTTGKYRYGNVYLGRSPIVAAANLQAPLLVITFLARSAADDDRRVLFVQSSGSNSDVWTTAVPGGIEAYINTDGTLGFGVQRQLTGHSAQSVVDGRSHIMFADAGTENIGIDTTTLTGGGGAIKTISNVNGVGIGGAQGLRARRHFDGWIGCVALFASFSTVGSAGRTEILNAYTKLDGQRTDQHITWVLDHLGVPAGLRNLSAGTVLLGPADTEGKDALEYMRQVTATEGGALFVDHRDGGKIRFTDRYHRFLDTRSTASQATFTDDPASALTIDIRYTAEGLDVASNGLDGIVNQATVSWTGGEVTIQDDTSLASYGPRIRSVDTVATLASQARSTAEWLVARYAQPRSRIRGCTASARHTQDRNDKVQALKIHDRVTFRLQPLHTGTAMTTTLYVDGVSHVAQEVEWETSFRFAQAETFTPWIWGTSAWNTTAYWG